MSTTTRAAEQATRSPTKLYSVGMGETSYSILARHLRQLPPTQKAETVILHGETMTFLQQRNGAWVEVGALFRTDLELGGRPNAAIVMVKNTMHRHPKITGIFGGVDSNIYEYSSDQVIAANPRQ